MTLDCLDAERMAAFWASVLGFEAGPIGQFTSIAGDAFDLTLQTVADPKIGKNRMHFDLRVENLDAEIERLVELGASLIERSQVPGWTWAVMADPEGNEFCVMRPDWFLG